MSKINVLDKHTAELIAAGEVVERPSSVIKELVENCVDAGATSIDIVIKNGGVTYMSVTDNGEGMEREDVPVAFLRHATSKVRNAPDLDAISTLGFRGEALASIAAVSRVEIITRREEDLAGTHYTIEGGEAGELSDIGCAKGTTIVVKDLFFNVPARMKFLKKDVSEGNAVAAIVDRLAMSHPEIAFRLTRDGKEELCTTGDGDLRNCIYAVLGKDFAKNLIPVEYSLDGVTVNGFVSSPSAPRPNRTMQHFFVNHRYVKTRTAMAALEQAYKGVIMGGKFPACVLFIDLPAETVDANVHPAKIEIRFIDERPVFSAVYHAVKTALESGVRPKSVTLPKVPSQPAPSQLHLDFSRPISHTVSPQSSGTAKVSTPRVSVDIVRTGDMYAQKTDTSLKMSDIATTWGDLQEERHTPNISVQVSDGEQTVSPSHNTDVAAFVEVVTEKETVSPPSTDEVQVRVVDEADVRPTVQYIGELFSTYLLAQMGEELFVIDKHAAHERLLYDRLIAAEYVDSQQLLAPISVTLSREEYAALLPKTEVMSKSGFDVEDFGGSEVLVRAYPMILSGCDIAQIVREIAGGFASGGHTVESEAIDWIYHSTACRAAVKAGDISRPEELAAFAERVLLHEDIRTCPHGRPVCFSLTRQEIEKQFGRIV